MTLFTEIAVALALSALIGIFMHVLRQPTVVGFILAGVLIGSFGISGGLSGELVQNLSSIGVALLLFIVGLEMDLRSLKHIGLPSLFAGLGQMGLSFVLGVALSQALGFDFVSSLYLAAALSFSSTIIVIKFLSEKRDLLSLHGRITTGILIVQDLVAIIILIFLSGLSPNGEVQPAMSPIVINGLIFVALTILFFRILPKFLDLIGGSIDLLFLFSLAWAIGISSAASLLGLSYEIGGLLAGLALSASSEHFQIAARLRSVRDFFLILFFVGLGAKLTLSGIPSLGFTVLLVSLFVLLSRPLATLIPMRLLGYGSRVSFLTGLSLAQISEFSLIIVAIGNRLGHIGNEVLALVTAVTIVTIFISSYFIAYGNSLYGFFQPVLKIFDRRGGREEIKEYAGMHTVLIGVNRVGRRILRTLIESGVKFLAIDFDPVIVKSLRARNLPVIYGDISDPDMGEAIGLESAKVIISTVPDLHDSLAILNYAKQRNSGARLVLSAENEFGLKTLYALGADYVLLPHLVGGEAMAHALRDDKELANLPQLKERDLKLLEELK